MDKEKVMQRIKEAYEILPEDIQKAIMDSSYQETLTDIAKNNKLTYEQLGSLEMQTTMVMLGLTHPNSFRHDLGEDLEIKDQELLKKIVEEVNERIFKNIRESLQAIHEVNESDTDDDNETFWKVGHENEKVPGDGEDEEEITSPQPSPYKGEGAQPAVSPLINKEGGQGGGSSDIFKKSGIEFINPVVKVPTPIPQPTDTERNKILSGVENPIAGTSAMNVPPKESILEKKLTTSFGLPKVESDHTVPNITKAEDKKVSSDPYREAI